MMQIWWISSSTLCSMSIFLRKFKAVGAGCLDGDETAQSLFAYMHDASLSDCFCLRAARKKVNVRKCILHQSSDDEIEFMNQRFVSFWPPVFSESKLMVEADDLVLLKLRWF